MMMKKMRREGATDRDRCRDSSGQDFGGMISPPEEEEPMMTPARATCDVAAPQTTAQAKCGDSVLSVPAPVLAGGKSAWTQSPAVWRSSTSRPNSGSTARSAPRFRFEHRSILPTRKKRGIDLSARSSSRTVQVRLPFVQESPLSRSGSFRALCAQSGAVPALRRSTLCARLESRAAASAERWWGATHRYEDGPAVRSWLGVLL